MFWGVVNLPHMGLKSTKAARLIRDGETGVGVGGRYGGGG